MLQMQSLNANRSRGTGVPTFWPYAELEIFGPAKSSKGCSDLAHLQNFQCVVMLYVPLRSHSWMFVFDHAL